MKLTSRFRNDLKALKEIGKYLKSNKLYNSSEPIPEKTERGIEISTPRYGNETKNVKDFLKNILSVLGNSQLKKDNPNVTFENITLNVNLFRAFADKSIDGPLLRELSDDLPKLAVFLNKNKNDKSLIDAYLQYVTGIKVRWSDPDKSKRWQVGMGKSIARQEKERPGWSQD